MDRLVTSKIPVRNPILLNLLNLRDSLNKATEKDPVLTAAMMEKLQKARKARSCTLRYLKLVKLAYKPIFPLS